MEYKFLTIDEAERIKEIDAEWHIKNAWRTIDGKRVLVAINWTEHDLPNGLPWHLERFIHTVKSGGAAVGCFDKDVLVGYGTLDREVFGEKHKHVLLDQLFISKSYRNQGIGRKLVDMMNDKAGSFGADRIYVCAAAAEETILFYQKQGFVDAVEINQALLAQDPNDIQMERAVLIR